MSDASPSFPPTLLNEGLALAMAWGEDWLRPIQVRLAERHPELTAVERDRLDALCRAAMRHGHDTVARLATSRGMGAEARELLGEFEAIVRERSPWIDPDNLGRLFSQGMYYAMR
jgi:hypothetical protein